MASAYSFRFVPFLSICFGSKFNLVTLCKWSVYSKCSVAYAIFVALSILRYYRFNAIILQQYAYEAICIRREKIIKVHKQNEYFNVFFLSGCCCYFYWTEFEHILCGWLNSEHNGLRFDFHFDKLNILTLTHPTHTCTKRRRFTIDNNNNLTLHFTFILHTLNVHWECRHRHRHRHGYTKT